MNQPTIHTRFVYPPIPDRSFDWAAWRGEEDEDTQYGRGSTEQRAITELLEIEEV